MVPRWHPTPTSSLLGILHAGFALGPRGRQESAGAGVPGQSPCCWGGVDVAQPGSVQAACDKSVPAASLDALSLPGTLPARRPLWGSEPVLCPQQGTWLREGGCHTWGCCALAAPSMDRAGALQGTRDVPVLLLGPSPARRSGLQGGCGPSARRSAGKRKRGFLPHCFYHGMYQVQRCEWSI